MRVVALFALLAASAVAQDAVGSISGVVTDAETGEPLIGANVHLVGTQRGAATDIEGRYTVANVPAGSHAVRVSYVGYHVADTTLAVGDGLTLAFDMALAVNDDVIIEHVCGTPLAARGPFFARVVTYEYVADGCYAVEPGDAFTRDG